MKHLHSHHCCQAQTLPIISPAQPRYHQWKICLRKESCTFYHLCPDAELLSHGSEKLHQLLLRRVFPGVQFSQYQHADDVRHAGDFGLDGRPLPWTYL